MNHGPESIDSPQRLAALARSGLLDTSFEPTLDRLTKLITRAMRVPVALISLVDRDRQFFKSYCGLPEPWATQRETPLSHSFCQHVVTSGKSLIIPDAREHPILHSNLAIPDLGVVAYAGVPIRSPDGQVLGSLCAIDGKPRDWSAEDVKLLEALSLQISADIELHQTSANLASALADFRTIDDERRTMLRLTIHDLRTPLTAMLLGMDALRHLGPLNEEQETYMDISQRNGQALLGMVNNLLDISMVEQRGSAALRRSTCCPIDIVSTAVEQVTALALEKSILIFTGVGRELPTMSVDADKLVRVMVNLVANAIKFTQQGGRVTITASVVASDDVAGVRTTGNGDGASPDAAAIQFSVSDTGIGMENTSRIFEEGVKLDAAAVSSKSTGLGLTFCKRIVEAHHGRIWFTTTPGVGSVFYFTLPVTATTA